MKFKLILILGAFMFFTYISCKKVNVLPTDGKSEIEVLKESLKIPEMPYNYAAPGLPPFFSNHFVRIQDNTPAGNNVTDWGATLGRVLFYDTRLSKNYTISCASCHIQEFGFTDTSKFSKGFMGGLTKRHSMSLLNSCFYLSGRFFWDERAATLEEQVLMPIQDPVEMGMRLDSLDSRLRTTAYYPILFKYAFGSSEINSLNISKALAQFVRSMISYQSKYDIGRAMTIAKEDDFPNFSVQENIGKNIFMSNTKINCAGCHTTDVFIMDNPRNNGISISNDDEGVYVHTKDNRDIGKFKVPSLKNIAQRVNFMHDGSIRGLDGVLNHYNLMILPNPNLDIHLQDISGNPRTMNLSVDEIDALKAFLLTLTDTEITKDVKFSSPYY